MTSTKRFAIGTAALFLMGSAFHFVYGWLGKSALAAPFFPVNESVWEHLKLLSTSALVWLAVDWFLADKPNRRKFFAARAVVLPIGLLFIPVVAYFFIGAFGFESLVTDILFFLTASALYQYLALRLEKSETARLPSNTAGVAILVFIGLIFAVFTFLTPHLPLFLDQNTGGYGR